MCSLKLTLFCVFSLSTICRADCVDSNTSIREGSLSAESRSVCVCSANACECCLYGLFPSGDSDQGSSGICQTVYYDPMEETLVTSIQDYGKSELQLEVGKKHHGKSLKPICTHRGPLPAGFRLCFYVNGIAPVGNHTIQACLKVKVKLGIITFYKQDFGCLWIRREVPTNQILSVNAVGNSYWRCEHVIGQSGNAASCFSFCGGRDLIRSDGLTYETGGHSFDAQKHLNCFTDDQHCILGCFPSQRDI